MASTHNSDSHSQHAHTHMIVPIRYYVATYVFLLILTAITVGLYYYDLGDLNLSVSLLVAGIKAFAVMWIFMGLKWDRGFDRIAWFGSFVFVFIFMLLTFSDTFFRGNINPEHEGVHGLKSPVKLVKPGDAPSYHSK